MATHLVDEDAGHDGDQNQDAGAGEEERQLPAWRAQRVREVHLHLATDRILQHYAAKSW